MTLTNNLFFSGNIEIDTGNWEQIVHSLVTYGDCVWLHADAVLSKDLDPTISVRIQNTLKELQDEKKIRTWELEASTAYVLRKTSASRVISLEEHKSLYQNVNHAVLEGPGEVGNLAYGEQDIERTSKLIDYRQELWHLGIASLCGASSLVYEKSPTGRFRYSTYFRYESLNKKYTQTLFKKFEIPALSLLTTKDILELQKYAAALRRKVDGLLSTKVFEIGVPDRTVMKECEGLHHEYLTMLKNVIQEKTGNGILLGGMKDVAVWVTGLFLPATSIIPLAERFGHWLVNKQEYGFVLYMLELQKRAFRATHS